MRVSKVSLVGIALILFLVSVGCAQNKYPFQNPDLDVEKRIDNLISLLTLDEKIKCLSTNPSVPRLGIKGCDHIEGLHGAALGGPGKWGGENPITTTQFPQAYGLAETWDTEALQKVGDIEGYEARYLFQSDKYERGALVIRSPNVDLGRDPRWGRTEECYGEDPFFNGTMAVAMIKGLQGNDKRYWQAASLMKHFLANSNENGRDRSSSDFSEKLFHEYYSKPFRMGVELGGSRAFMASYNSWNGIPMMVNPVLKNVAVDQWKQNGIICTDGGALGLLIKSHKYYSNDAAGAAAAVKAGINQFLDHYDSAIRQALEKKLITEKDIETVIRGDFRVMIKLGLLDPPELNPYTKIKDGPEPWLSEKHKNAVREVTQKSIVLLKNDRNMLPLSKNTLKSLAIIGSKADQVLLDWYSGTPPYVVTALQGIKAKAGNNIQINYAENNSNNEAVNAAKKSEVAIVIVGNHPTCNAGWEQCPDAGEGKESVDRKSLTLTEEELIKQVYNANPNTIVVLVSSFPFAINWTQQNVPAILHMAQNSQELGNALADVLFGDYNPAGRLVQTWPNSLDELPPMMDYDITHGRTYMYFEGAPLYPFGFGKSYTSFSYSNLKLSATKVSTSGQLSISVDVKNTGSYSGDEVVQLYVSHINSKTKRPLKELKGFKRITISPNESKTVVIPLPVEALAYWDENLHQFKVEEGAIKLMVGASSADIKFEKTIEISNK
ncbi:glycoside hydrolase family 3 C-terminal domain-containing protein [Solitalea sp. MAHUQ-68]|uniref:Glycoside hydrolase family 3 C-terminal domain-containing protein n=1 Tax=Solitalea agri TaxID=2953739 RepID=A0A9X2EZ08_9SPHI|nr:glycoside hydrolase family 3 C-terminal domain-containing protein [Solitalea agri]MCO4291567.1 glycoside hydrolase family 3 C-terminal domain-containing protein [Solitalea agri]